MKQRVARPHLHRIAVTPSCGTHARQHRLIVGNLAHCASCPLPQGSVVREVLALLGMKQTPCQWSILRLLLAHPLLPDEELAAWLASQQKSVRSALYTQHALGCLEPGVTSAGKRWHRCERGLRLLAAADHLPLRHIATCPDEETDSERAVLVEREELRLLLHIQHTAGIYGFFAALAQATRREPEAAYSMGQSQFQFWLEWDRAP